MTDRPSYVSSDLTYVGTRYSKAIYEAQQFQVWEDPQGNLRSFGRVELTRTRAPRSV